MNAKPLSWAVAIVGTPVFFWLGSHLITHDAPRSTQASAPALDLDPYRTDLVVGDALGDFPVTRSDGTESDWQTLLGSQPAAVLVVTTGCQPCQREIDRWAQYARQHPEVTVVGLSGEAPDALAAFAQEKDLPFPMISDRNGAVIRDHGIHIFPTVLGIDSQSRIAYLHQEYEAEMGPAEVIAMLRAEDEPSRWSTSSARASN